MDQVIPRDATTALDIGQLTAALGPVVDAGVVHTSTTFDALNRPLTVTSPDGSVFRPTFNEANLLDKVDVELRGASAATAFVTDIDYNAKGQREKVDYKNGATTAYEYDPLTFRLSRLKTTRPANADATASQLFKDPSVVQDLRYSYDPVGNITRIQDVALKTIIRNGQNVEPVGAYTYDAIYRLIEAKGREHIGQSAFDFNPPNGDHRDYPIVGHRAHPNDLQALRNYTERYEYDPVGNFEALAHRFNGAGWTRRYDNQENSLLEAGKKSNRLTKTTVGNGVNQMHPYTHDAHGNMTSMPHLAAMVWDFKDQFQQADLGGGGTAYYVYDGAGQRVRKVIESQNGTRQKERLYLGGFEIYREYNGAGISLERESLHVFDDKQRTALVETQTIQNGNAVNGPVPVQRYQLGNHLGSSSVELDKDGALIAYEEYHPYGTTSFQAGRSAAEVSLRRYRYTGKERDEESGLHFHGARYYAAWLGRWTAADPAGFIDGPNLYAYARLNPALNSDPTGYASQEQFQHIITSALEKAQAGNRTAVGTAAETVLEGMLNKAGYTIIKGPATNPGQHFADIVAYDPNSKELLFFDNKHIANKKSVSRADAFVDLQDDAETAARKAGVIAEAQERFADIAQELPADQLDGIKKAFTKAAADPGSANFIVANATPKAVKNLVEKISERLINRGVKFADASGGSKKLKADIDAKLAKGADATADALKAGSSAGKQLLKSLPAIGIGISAGLAIPRVAQAAEDDLAYEEQAKALGEQPLFADLSVLRETAVIAGEEGGGELGGWGGAALGASVSWETGPGVILGTVGGAVLFGLAGDSIGGAAAGYLFDRAAKSLYEQRMATR